MLKHDALLAKLPKNPADWNPNIRRPAEASPGPAAYWLQNINASVRLCFFYLSATLNRDIH